MSLKTQRLAFGPFTLDHANNLLLHDETPVPLAPKAFDTLTYLAENSRRLVTREELMKAIWPDSFVEDANVTVNISLIRKALGEMQSGLPYIETVPRRGYRFNAEVRLVDEPLGSILPQASASPSAGLLDPGHLPAGHGAPNKEAVARQPGTHQVIAFQERKEAPEPHPELAAAFTARPRSSTARAPHRLWTVAAVICLGVAALVASRLFRHGSRPSHEFRERRLTSFASEMAVSAAGISTGGKFVAYANPAGLLIQVISTGETHALALPEPNFEVSGISWFPNSAELLVGGSAPGDDASSLWIVPVIGTGPAIKLGPYPAGVVSPDGSRIALADGTGAAPRIEMMRSDGSEWHTLVTGAGGETFGGVSWSRDGRRIVFTRFRWDPQFRMNSGSIDSCDVATGKTTVILRGADFAGGVVSLRDGRVAYLVNPGAHSAVHGGELFAFRTDPRTGAASNPPALIAKWDSPVTGLSANAAGTQLAVRDMIVQQNAYLGDLEDGGTRLVNVRRVSFLAGGEDLPRAWTPDGRAILSDSNRNGRWEIFKQDLDGGADVPFIQGPGDQFAPEISPDRAWVLYLSRPEEWREPEPVSLMRVAIAGGAPQPVLSASGISEWELRFKCPRLAGRPCVMAGRQGNQIVFRAFDPATNLKSRAPELGHVPFGSDLHFAWALAPDGLSVAWIEWNPADNRVHILPLASTAEPRGTSGSERRVAINGASYLHSIVWTPDGTGWYLTTQQPGRWTLLYSTMQGKSSTLLRVANNLAPDVFPSPDGRYLAFSEETSRSNVWLLQNF